MRAHLVFGALLGAALALAGAGATEARGDFVLYGSESLTVDTSHTTGYLWDTSRIMDVAGGDVDYLYAYYSSTVDISDGSVTFLHAFSTSTADISGGSVDQLESYGSSLESAAGHDCL